jgi:hypothetical protein
VARRYLTLDRLLTVVAGDATGLEAPLREGGPLEIWDPNVAETSY